ncbi:MAG: hypothetical protein ABEJ28_03605 [Salinigranum sp.]
MFLLPLLLVLGIHALRIVVADLIHGKPLTSQVEIEEGLGSDPLDEPVGDDLESEITEEVDPDTDRSGDAESASDGRTAGDDGTGNVDGTSDDDGSD